MANDEKFTIILDGIAMVTSSKQIIDYDVQVNEGRLECSFRMNEDALIYWEVVVDLCVLYKHGTKSKPMFISQRFKSKEMAEKNAAAVEKYLESKRKSTVFPRY